jgi:hypothetical protein
MFALGRRRMEESRPMTKSALRLALAAGAVCGVVAAGALGAENAAAASAHHRAAKSAQKIKAPAKEPAKRFSTVAVTVTNARPATLIELQARASGSDKMKKVLGYLKPGKQAIARIPRGESCEADLHGTFDDGQTMDSSGVNLCADKTFTLTD